MVVAADRQSDQIEPFTGHALEQIRRRRLAHPVRQPAFTAEQFLDNDRAKAVLVPGHRCKERALAGANPALHGQSCAEFVDDLLQTPQTHRYVDKVTPILFPIFTEPTCGGGEQIDQDGIDTDAAIEDVLDIIKEVIGLYLQR